MQRLVNDKHGYSFFSLIRSAFFNYTKVSCWFEVLQWRRIAKPYLFNIFLISDLQTEYGNKPLDMGQNFNVYKTFVLFTFNLRSLFRMEKKVTIYSHIHFAKLNKLNWEKQPPRGILLKGYFKIFLAILGQISVTPRLQLRLLLMSFAAFLEKICKQAS